MTQTAIANLVARPPDARLRWAGLVLLFACTGAGPATAPAAPHGMLDQLNRETQSLYRDVQGGVARVQLPPPRYLNELADRDNPLDKWGGQLDPDVRAQLERQRRAAQQGQSPRYTPKIVPAAPEQAPPSQQGQQPRPAPATLPATQAGNGSANGGAAWRFTAQPGSDTVVIESTGEGSGSVIQIHTGGEVASGGRLAPAGSPEVSFQPAGSFAPNNVGLVLDEQGHLLVPNYVEREAVPADGFVRVSIADGPVLNARFVASDQVTNVTILQLEKPAGRPIKVGSGCPADGSLVLMLSPNAGTGRLIVWSGAQRDFGVVVTVDGAVAGFSRGGQFLAADACSALVEQLLRDGRAKRPTLGLAISCVGRDDPLRERVTDLGTQPALLVMEVSPDSSAARAGLKRGDLILSLRDQRVGDPPSLAAVLAGCRGPTPLELLRDGRRMTVTVELRTE